MPQSTIPDFISGTAVKATPEEVQAVQPMARKLVRDYGYEKAQIQTRPQFRVKRHPHDRAKYPVDIAVFSTTPRSDESLRIVVECKRKNEDLDHSEDQLRSYLALSKATFGVLYNGDEFRCFKKSIDRKQVEIVSAPDIPRAGEPVDHAESIRYGALLPPNDLVMEFQHIRNRIAGSGIGSISTEGTARNIINLLFCKMMDEKNARSQNTVMEFRFDEQESSQRVAERVQRLFTKVPGHYGDVVPAEEAISLDEETISAIVAVLQKYKLLGSRRDVVGNAFEVFIGPALAGDEGQFFTPRTVVDTMVRMAGVGPDERVLDPACGSGGFLTVCMKRMFEAISDKTFSAEAQEEERRRVAQHSLFGVDKNQFLARVAKAYMAILGDGSTNILCDDSLLPRAKWGAKTQGAVEFGIFDVVLTNPPFGKNLQVDKRVSAQYELGSARSNVPPQILFLERCLEFLREDGRLGIVLPEGIFGNPQHQHVREWLMRHADIVALVSLPAAAFKISGKQGTSTRTQFAILRKRARGKQNEPIFMAIATKVGHDSRGQEIPRNDLPDIAKRFEDFEARGSLAVEGRLGYLVRPEALESDLSLVCRRYDPDIGRRLEELRVSGYELKTFGELEKELVISIRGGGGGAGEIRKTLYDGLRPSGRDHRAGDILFVKDGGRLIGRCAMVHEEDLPFVLQSHFYRIRCERPGVLDPYLLLAVLCRETTRAQIRTRVVVQSTLGTVAGRLADVVLAIPKDASRRKEVAAAMQRKVAGRRMLLAMIGREMEDSPEAASDKRETGIGYAYRLLEGDAGDQRAAEPAGAYRTRSRRAREE